MRRRIPTEWPYGRFYGPLRRFGVSNYPEGLKGRLTHVLERSPGRLARAAAAQPDTNLQNEIHLEDPEGREPPLWRWPPPSGDPKRSKEQKNA